MNVTRQLFVLVLARRYQLTDHAMESMDDDGLTISDVLACLGGGRLRRAWPRQRKYEVEGRSLRGRTMRVVARLPRPGLARIITVYEVH